jgi:hypothetical protein
VWWRIDDNNAQVFMDSIIAQTGEERGRGSHLTPNSVLLCSVQSKICQVRIRGSVIRGGAKNRSFFDLY